jgi:hypothetical protein
MLGDWIGPGGIDKKSARIPLEKNPLNSSLWISAFFF